MPLIPEKEIEEQIRSNEAILCKHFGDDLKLRGFFLPEMAYSASVGKLIKKAGYEWIVLDEIALGGKLEQVDFNKFYLDKKSGLKVVFRSRKFSNKYIPETVFNLLSTDVKTVITASDGELYGLRHNDPTGKFEKLLKKKGLETETISNFLNSAEETEQIDLVDCSWESTEAELKDNKPYVLWFDKENLIQQKLWDLANLVYESSEKYKNDENYYWANWHLVRGLASCTFWWASGKDFSHIFGPHAWNPDEIEKGMNEFVRSIRAIQDVASREVKLEAEGLYIEIKKLIWEKHWNEHWKNNK